MNNAQRNCRPAPHVNTGGLWLWLLVFGLFLPTGGWAQTIMNFNSGSATQIRLTAGASTNIGIQVSITATNPPAANQLIITKDGAEWATNDMLYAPNLSVPPAGDVPGTAVFTTTINLSAAGAYQFSCPGAVRALTIAVNRPPVITSFRVNGIGADPILVLGPSLNFTFAVNDPDGIADIRSVELVINGIVTAIPLPYTSFIINPMPSGSLSAQLRVKDALATSYVYSPLLNLNIKDNEPPTVDINTPVFASSPVTLVAPPALLFDTLALPPIADIPWGDTVKSVELLLKVGKGNFNPIETGVYLPAVPNPEGSVIRFAGLWDMPPTLLTPDGTTLHSFGLVARDSRDAVSATNTIPFYVIPNAAPTVILTNLVPGAQYAVAPDGSTLTVAGHALDESGITNITFAVTGDGIIGAAAGTARFVPTTNNWFVAQNVDIPWSFPITTRGPDNHATDMTILVTATDLHGLAKTATNTIRILRALNVREVLPLAGGDFTQINASGSGGDAAGYSTTTDGTPRAIRWNNKQGTVRLDYNSDGLGSQATAINSSGNTVGYSKNVAGRLAATVWSANGNVDTLISLNDVLDITATGIADNNQIVGYSGNIGVVWDGIKGNPASLGDFIPFCISEDGALAGGYTLFHPSDPTETGTNAAVMRLSDNAVFWVNNAAALANGIVQRIHKQSGGTYGIAGVCNNDNSPTRGWYATCDATTLTATDMTFIGTATQESRVYSYNGNYYASLYTNGFDNAYIGTTSVETMRLTPTGWRFLWAVGASAAGETAGNGVYQQARRGWVITGPVIGNALPEGNVTLADSDASTQSSPATFHINFEGQDPDGINKKIPKVCLVANNAIIATYLNQTQFTFTWTAPNVGTYQIDALLDDNSGQILRVSGPLVTVAPNPNQMLYRLIPIATDEFNAYRINNNGDVVGSLGNEAVLWHGGMWQLGNFGADSAEILAINNSGQLLINTYRDITMFNTVTRAWLANENLELKEVTRDPGDSITATALNDSGLVAGNLIDSALVNRPFLWDGNNVTFLGNGVAGTITPTQIGPDASQITASLTLANGKSQVGLLSPNNFTPFPTLGGLQNEVNDYTPGYAVGGAQTGSALRPVVWSGAGTTWNLLQPAMPAEAVAGTLNGIVAGTPPVVAGTLDGPNGEWVPVIGTPTALQSLNVLLAPADKTTWTLDSVIGINPAGQVLATAYDTAENPYVVLLVPEDVYRTNTPPRITSAYSLLPRATNTVPFDLQLNDTAPGRVTIAQMLVWSGTTNTVVLEKHWLRASSAVEWNTFWSPEQAGTYKIFFRVTDNLGKTTIYPNGADINENLATQVTVTLALTETEMVVERIGVPSNAEWNQPHLVSQTTSPTLPILPTPLTITNLMGLGLDENGHTFGVLKFQGSLRFSALGATYYGTNWTPWVSSNNTVYIIAPPLLGVGSGYYEPIIECTPLAMSGNSQVYGNIKLATGIGASKTTNTFSFQAPINTRGPTIIHGPIAAYTGDPNVGNYRKLKAVNRDDFVIGDGNYKTNNIMTQFNYLCLDDQFQFLPTPNPPLAKGTLPTAYVSSLNNLDDIGGLLLFYINNTIPNNYFFPMYWTRSGPNQLGAHTATLLPKPANILFKDTDQQGLTYLNDLRRAVHEGYHTNGPTLEYYAYQRNLNDPACAADLLVYQPLTNTISRPIMAGWNNRSQALLALRDGTAVKNYFVIGGRRLLVNDLIAGKTAFPLLLDVATAINQNGQIVVNGRPNAVNSMNGQSYLISPKYMLVANSATTDVLQNTDFSVNIDFINKDTESKTLQLVLTLPVGVTIGTVPPNAVRQNNPADGTTTLTLAQLVGKAATSTTLTTLTLTSVLAPPANIAITNYTATLSDGVIISGTPRVWKTTAVPVVTIDSPTDGASFAASSPIPISATANSYNGAITSLEMMLDETNLLTTAATLTPQAQIGWTNSIPGLTTGLHTLHAKATDTRNIQGGKTITLHITKPITPGAPNGYLKAFYEQALVFDQQSVTNPVRIGITVTATANPLHSIAILINGMVYRTLAGLTANTYVFSVPWLNPTPGDYQLTAQITDTAGSSFTTDPLTIHVYRTPPAPPNDMLANATDLAASMKGRFNQWTNLNNYGATWQAGEPQHAKKDSASSVWYAWPCTNSGRTLIKAIPTPSATPLDTILAVYTPTLPTAPLSFTNLTLIDANDDSGASIGSAITFNASANKTYYIMVSGYGDAQGKFTLLISQTELPIVSIINPKDGDNLRAGDTVTVTIQTSDPDGAISAVELYDNGTLISGIGNGSVGGISEIPNSETISEIGLTATASSWAGWNLISQGWRPGPKINDQGDIVFNRVGAANVGATLYTFNGMISIGAHKPVIVPALADIALKWKGVIPPNNPAQIDPNNTQLGSGQPVSFQTLLPELLPTQKPPVTIYGSQFANNPIALSCGTGVTNLISREAYYMQRFLAPADNPTMSFFLRANEAAQLEFDGSILLSFPRHTAFVGDPNADVELMRAQYSWNSRSGVQTLTTHAFYDNYIFLPVPCNDTLARLNNFTLIANSARDTLAKYYNGQSKAITVNGIPPGWHTIVIRYGAGEPRDLNRMANPGDPLYIFPDGFGGLASNPNYNKALNDMMAFYSTDYSTDNIHWRSIDTLPPLQTAHSGIAGIDNTGRSAVNYRSANVFTTDDIYTTAFIGRPNNDLAPVPTPSTFSRYTYWTGLSRGGSAVGLATADKNWKDPIIVVAQPNTTVPIPVASSQGNRVGLNISDSGTWLLTGNYSATSPIGVTNHYITYLSANPASWPYTIIDATDKLAIPATYSNAIVRQVNNTPQEVGSLQQGDRRYAALWSRTTFTKLIANEAGPIEGEALTINAGGDMGGYAIVRGNQVGWYRLSGGNLTFLDSSSAAGVGLTITAVTDISNNRDITGYAIRDGKTVVFKGKSMDATVTMDNLLQFLISSLSPGTHDLVVRVYDNDGASAETAPVAISTYNLGFYEPIEFTSTTPDGSYTAGIKINNAGFISGWKTTTSGRQAAWWQINEANGITSVTELPTSGANTMHIADSSVDNNDPSKLRMPALVAADTTAGRSQYAELRAYDLNGALYNTTALSALAMINDVNTRGQFAGVMNAIPFLGYANRPLQILTAPINAAITAGSIAIPNALDGYGNVVGYYQGADHAPHGILWEAMTDLTGSGPIPLDWWPANGTPTNAMTGDSGVINGAVTYANRPNGQAFNFSTPGYGNNITCGTNAGNFRRGDFMVAFDVKTTASTPQYFISKGPPNCVADGTGFWGIHTTPRGQFIEMNLQMNADGSDRVTLSGTKPINDGNWHHVTVGRQGKLIFLTIDNTYDQAVATGGILLLENAYPLRLGPTLCAPNANAQLDEIKLYNHAVPPDEMHIALDPIPDAASISEYLDVGPGFLIAGWSADAMAYTSGGLWPARWVYDPSTKSAVQRNLPSRSKTGKAWAVGNHNQILGYINSIASSDPGAFTGGTTGVLWDHDELFDLNGLIGLNLGPNRNLNYTITAAYNMAPDGGIIVHALKTQGGGTATAVPLYLKPKLKITATADIPSDTPVHTGTEISYTVIATNNLPDALNNVTISIPLPKGTLLEQADPFSYRELDTLFYEFPSIQINASLQIQFKVRVTQAYNPSAPYAQVQGRIVEQAGPTPPYAYAPNNLIELADYRISSSGTPAIYGSPVRHLQTNLPPTVTVLSPLADDTLPLLYAETTTNVTVELYIVDPDFDRDCDNPGSAKFSPTLQTNDYLVTLNGTTVTAVADNAAASYYGRTFTFPAYDSLSGSYGTNGALTFKATFNHIPRGVYPITFSIKDKYGAAAVVPSQQLTIHSLPLALPFGDPGSAAFNSTFLTPPSRVEGRTVVYRANTEIRLQAGAAPARSWTGNGYTPTTDTVAGLHDAIASIALLYRRLSPIINDSVNNGDFATAGLDGWPVNWRKPAVGTYDTVATPTKRIRFAAGSTVSDAQFTTGLHYAVSLLARGVEAEGQLTIKAGSEDLVAFAIPHTDTLQQFVAELQPTQSGAITLSANPVNAGANIEITHLEVYQLNDSGYFELLPKAANNTDPGTIYRTIDWQPGSGTYYLQTIVQDQYGGSDRNNQSPLDRNTSLFVRFSEPPVVAITAPVNGYRFDFDDGTTQTVPIAVSYGPGDHYSTVAQVILLADSTQVATTNTGAVDKPSTTLFPYVVSQSATNLFLAIAYNSDAVDKTSGPVRIVFNARPDGIITSPGADKVVHISPDSETNRLATFTVNNLRDANGWVTNALYEVRHKLDNNTYETAALVNRPIAPAEVTSFGYWTNPITGPGTYELYVTLSDNLGATRVLGPNSFTINRKPEAEILTPANNTTNLSQVDIPVTIKAYDEDPGDQVSAITLKVNNTIIETRPLVTESENHTYTFTWKSVKAGIYDLTAIASDTRGGTNMSRPIRLVVNTPPVITWLKPTNNYLGYGLTALDLAVQASDIDDNLTKIDFVSVTPINGVYTLPKAGNTVSFMTWTNPPLGLHCLQAIARDALGGTTTNTIYATLAPQRRYQLLDVGILADGNMTAINTNDIGVGYYKQGANNGLALDWDGEPTQITSATDDAYPLAISETRRIVGLFNNRPSLWINRIRQDLPIDTVPGATDGGITSLSHNGFYAGGYANVSDQSQAIYWDLTSGTPTPAPVQDPAKQIYLTHPSGVNAIADNGDLAGFYTDSAAGLTHPFTKINGNYRFFGGVVGKPIAMGPNAALLTTDLLATTTPITFITGQTAGTARNTYSGYLGMKFTVGANSLEVTDVGRLFVDGNRGLHTVGIVSGDTGQFLPGGVVNLNLNGGASDQYSYTNLAEPIILAAGKTYCLVSSEVYGADNWYDADTVVTTTGAATAAGATYSTTAPLWQFSGGVGNSYGTLNFKYREITKDPSAQIGNKLYYKGNWFTITNKENWPTLMAQHMNKDGKVVGYYQVPAQSERQGFIWINGAFFPLNDLLPGVTMKVNALTHISDNGRLVGVGTIGAERHGIVCMPPEWTNHPPKTAWVRPLPSENFEPNTPIIMNVNAVDPDGYIKRVEYYITNALVRITRTADAGQNYYVAGPSDYAVGEYFVKAVVYDKYDSKVELPTRRFTVDRNPTVQISPTLPGVQLIHEGDVFGFSATTTDPDVGSPKGGVVSSVKYTGTNQWGNTVSFNSSQKPDFTGSTTWNLWGTYTIRGTSYDDLGVGSLLAGSGSPYTIRVNARPKIEFLQPANAIYTYTNGLVLPVTIRTSDPDGDGIVNTTLGIDDNLNYASVNGDFIDLTLNGLQPGSHRLIVTATDGVGGSRTQTKTIILNLPPNLIHIETPAPGDELNVGNPYTIRISATDPNSGTIPGSISIVYATILDANRKSMGSLMLPKTGGDAATGYRYETTTSKLAVPGPNTIQVHVVDANGADVWQEVEVAVNAAPNIIVTQPTAATATLKLPNTGFNIVAQVHDPDGVNPVASVEFYAAGAATPFATPTESSGSYTATYTGVLNVGPNDFYIRAADAKGARAVYVLTIMGAIAPTVEAPLAALATTPGVPAAFFTIPSSGNLVLRLTSLAIAPAAANTLHHMEFYDNGTRLTTTTTYDTVATNIQARRFVTYWTNPAVGSHTLSAIAYNDKGIGSDPQQSALRISSTPGTYIQQPTAQQVVNDQTRMSFLIDVIPQAGQTVKTVNTKLYAGSGTTGLPIAEWVNLDVPTRIDTELTGQFAPGTYTLFAQAIVHDVAANTDFNSTPATQVFYVNGVPSLVAHNPSLINIPTDGYDLNVTASDTDRWPVKTIEFYENGVLFASTTTTLTTVLTAQPTSVYSAKWWNPTGTGTKTTLTIRAIDTAGAVATLTRDIPINSNPNVTVLSPRDATVYRLGEAVTINATAQSLDDAGIITFTYSLDGVGKRTLTGPAATLAIATSETSLPAGNHAVVFEATDAVGGITRATRSFHITKPPTVALLTPTNNQVEPPERSFTVTAEATDDKGIYKLQLLVNGTVAYEKPYANSTTYVFTPILNAGYYELSVVAINNDGLQSTTPTIAIRVNAAPNITLTQPSGRTIYQLNDSVTYSATATDNDGAIRRVDFFDNGVLLTAGLTIAPGAFGQYNWASTLPAGRHLINARATDDNLTTKDSDIVEVIINEPPLATITAPKQDELVTTDPLNNSITLTIHATDNQTAYGDQVNRVELYDQSGVKIGDATLSSTNTTDWNFTWYNISKGVKNIYTVTHDAFGAQASTATTPVSFTVTDPPLLSIITPPDGTTLNPATPAGATATTFAAGVATYIRRAYLSVNNVQVGIKDYTPIMSGQINDGSFERGTWQNFWTLNTGPGATITLSRINPYHILNSLCFTTPGAGARSDISGNLLTSEKAYEIVFAARAKPQDGTTTTITVNIGGTIKSVPITEVWQVYRVSAVAHNSLLTIGLPANAPASMYLDNVVIVQRTETDTWNWVWGTQVPVDANVPIVFSVIDGLGTLNSVTNWVSVNYPPLLALLTPAPDEFGMATVQGNIANLSVNASDPDGSVTNVTYYTINGFNKTLIGASTDASQNFPLVYQRSDYAQQVLRIEAYDNLGTLTATTNILQFNHLPLVTLTAPTNQQLLVITPGNNDVFPVTTTTSSSDDTISTVRLVDAYQLTDPALVYETNTPSSANTYQLYFTPTQPGTHQLKAQTIDSRNGHGESAPVNVIVDARPLVTFALPVNTADHAVIQETDIPTFKANVYDPGDTITKLTYTVTDLLNNTDYGRFDGNPNSAWSYTWPGTMKPSTYSIVAAATDSFGIVGTKTLIMKVNRTPTDLSWVLPNAQNNIYTLPLTLPIKLTGIDYDADSPGHTVLQLSPSLAVALTTKAIDAADFEFTTALINPTAQTYTMVATYTDNDGATRQSAPMTMIVNTAPACALAYYLNGAADLKPLTAGTPNFIALPNTLKLHASYSDADAGYGDVATSLVLKQTVGATTTTLATSPGTDIDYTGNPLNRSRFDLVESVTDSRGATTTTSYNIRATYLPVISTFTKSVAASRINAGTAITFTVTGYDADSGLASAELWDYYNNAAAPIGTKSLAGPTTAQTLSWTWTATGSGAHKLTVRLKDTDDAVTENTMTFTVNDPPMITWVHPSAAGAVVAAGENNTAEIAVTDDLGNLRSATFEALSGAVARSLPGASRMNYAGTAWTLNWTPTMTTTALRAIVTDNDGMITTNVIALVPDTRPTIAWTTPTVTTTNANDQPINFSFALGDPDQTDRASLNVVVGTATDTILVTNVAAGTLSFAWLPTLTGDQSIKAVVTDRYGLTNATPRLLFRIDSRPQIYWAATPPAYLRPTATTLLPFVATDDAAVASVSVYAQKGGSSVFVGSAAPSATEPDLFVRSFIPAASGLAAGIYNLYAIATDNLMVTNRSTNVTIKITTPPNITIYTPAAQRVLTLGATETVVVIANDVDSGDAVTNLNLSINGTLITNHTLTGATVATTNQVPVNGTKTWAITAIASDTYGAATTNTAVYTINSPPTAAFVSPTTGTKLVAQRATQLTVQAADTDGTIKSVALSYTKAGGARSPIAGIPTLTGTTYALTFTPPANGNYVFYAVATDNNNATNETSVAVTVVNTATITLATPMEAAAYRYVTPGKAVAVPVQASAVVALGTVTNLELVVQDPANNIILDTQTAGPSLSTSAALTHIAGTITTPYKLTIKATDNNGNTAEKSLTVNIVGYLAGDLNQDGLKDLFFQTTNGNGEVEIDAVTVSATGQLLTETAIPSLVPNGDTYDPTAWQLQAIGETVVSGTTGFVWSNPGNPLHYTLYRADHTVTAQTLNYTLPADETVVALQDMDLDGQIDLVTQSPTKVYYINLVTGNKTALPISQDPLFGNHVIGTADPQSDGRPKIVQTRYSSPNYYIRIWDGPTALSTWMTASTLAVIPTFPNYILGCGGFDNGAGITLLYRSKLPSDWLTTTEYLLWRLIYNADGKTYNTETKYYLSHDTLVYPPLTGR